MGWVRAGWQRGRGREIQKKEQNGGRPLSWLTILPDAKIRAVVLGSRMRMMTAAKRCGEERTERGCVRNRRSLARGRWRRPRGRRRRSHFCPSLRPAPPSPPTPPPPPPLLPHLGVVFRIAGVQGDVLQVQLAVQVDSRDHVLEGGHNARRVAGPVHRVWRPHRHRQGGGGAGRVGHEKVCVREAVCARLDGREKKSAGRRGRRAKRRRRPEEGGGTARTRVLLRFPSLSLGWGRPLRGAAAARDASREGRGGAALGAGSGVERNGSVRGGRRWPAIRALFPFFFFFPPHPPTAAAPLSAFLSWPPPSPTPPSCVRPPSPASRPPSPGLPRARLPPACRPALPSQWLSPPRPPSRCGSRATPRRKPCRIVRVQYEGA